MAIKRITASATVGLCLFQASLPALAQPAQGQLPDSTPLNQEASVPEASGSDFAALSEFRTEEISSGYILGPGDQVSIEFFNVPEYNGEKRVLVDGTLNLPIVGKVEVEGLTIEDTVDHLAVVYGSYLRTPMVTVDLISPRPISVGVSGEVNRPGAYDIDLVDGDSEDIVEWPTVVEAVQLAGGITEQADIRAIEILRLDGNGNSQTMTLDFWEILNSGRINHDISLRHGDAIYIPTATALTPQELTRLSEANFSPDNIQVSVVGEVASPGIVEVPPNAPLNQALLTAGGFDPARARRNEVELIRLNPDGTVAQRVVPIALNQGINEETNPALRNNDVIVVRQSGSASFSDAVGGIFGALGTILLPFSLLSDITDGF
jgi:polysaccharide export outer membrane protein